MDNLKPKHSRGLLLALANDLGERIAQIDAMASKGVHAEVSSFEVNQCVIQTYLIIGDILHIGDKGQGGGSGPGEATT